MQITGEIISQKSYWREDKGICPLAKRPIFRWNARIFSMKSMHKFLTIMPMSSSSFKKKASGQGLVQRYLKMISGLLSYFLHITSASV